MVLKSFEQTFASCIVISESLIM